MSPLAATLPSNDGYVAAAYIVFFALILMYVAIMAVRLQRVERRLRELQQRGREDTADGEQTASAWPAVEADAQERARERLEREAV